MSEFKYLNVVNDGTDKVKLKPDTFYRVLDYRYDSNNRSLIEPLHGTSPELAAQRYLFDHEREFMVHVKIAMPEHKYEQFTTSLMTRNPAIQKAFHDAQDVQSSEF